MSGGVGTTCSDISLAKEAEDEKLMMDSKGTKSIPRASSSPRRSKALLNFRQLNALAMIVVFSASGMVSLEDFIFVVFSVVYVYLLSKVAFPPKLDKGTTSEPPIFGEKNKMLTIYVSFAALIGLFLPIGYIFHGIVEGDKHGIKAAAPHVFLLASQVFMEGLTFSGGFSLPIRVFVPVFYNTKRVFTIVEWLRAEIGKVDEEFGGSEMRLYVGRSLAVANMAFWCFNLFGFLLPVYLPKAFKRYYGVADGANGAKTAKAAKD